MVNAVDRHARGHGTGSNDDLVAFDLFAGFINLHSVGINDLAGAFDDGHAVAFQNAAQAADQLLHNRVLAGHDCREINFDIADS